MNTYPTFKDELKNDYDDMESSNINIKAQMRLGFIRKVYGILSAQLLLTTIFSGIACLSGAFKAFLLQNFAITCLMIVLSIVLPFAIVCCPGPMRQVPQNYIILFIFTLAESFLVAIICSQTNPSIVFMAAFMTFCLCASLTIYAVTTKSDFTTQGGILFVLCCAVIMFSIFGMFTQNKILHVIICCLGIICFGFYLLYDTQLIIGTKSELIEEDDYILGSFILYTDIINIFLQILELLQIFSSRG